MVGVKYFSLQKNYNTILLNNKFPSVCMCMCVYFYLLKWKDLQILR